MRNIQFIGLLTVVAGSFLPLVKIPIVGTWNYWETDHNLAIVCWVFCLFTLIGILSNKIKLVRFAASILLLLFGFTILAVKFQSMDFFSFLPFEKLQKLAAGTVKLGWGWLLEFSGAFLILFAKKNN